MKTRCVKFIKIAVASLGLCTCAAAMAATSCATVNLNLTISNNPINKDFGFYIANPTAKWPGAFPQTRNLSVTPSPDLNYGGTAVIVATPDGNVCPETIFFNAQDYSSGKSIFQLVCNIDGYNIGSCGFTPNIGHSDAYSISLSDDMIVISRKP